MAEEAVTASQSVFSTSGVPNAESDASLTGFIVRIIPCLVAIAGNVLTIAAVVRTPRLQTKSNGLVVSLAVADLLVGANYTLILIIEGATGVCSKQWGIFRTFFFHICIMSSSFHILLIGFDRYIAIVHPLRYQMLLTPSRIKILVAAVWSMSFVACATFFVWMFLNIDQPLDCENKGLTVPELHRNILEGMVYFSIMFFIVVMYSQIFLIARRHRRQIRDMKTAAGEDNAKDSESTEIERKTKQRTNIMLSCIILAYIVAWTPYFTVVFRGVEVYGHTLFSTLLVVFSAIGFANSCINIVIYALASSEFRRAYIRLLCVACDKCETRSSTSSTS